MGEIGYRSIDGFFRDQYGAYFTIGKEIEKWFPYMTIARRFTRGHHKDQRTETLLPELAAAVESTLASTRFDSSLFSMGISREINNNIQLKLQADWIKTDNNSFGLYTNQDYDTNDEEYKHPKSNWLFSISLDFTF